MKATYFPAEGEWKVFSDDFKLLEEGFDSKAEAHEWIAGHTDQVVHDIYVIWNREFKWSHYGTYLGDEGLEEYKKKVLYQGDGARVKKIKSEVRS